MKPAKISFKNNTPYNDKFDDIYFNTDDPLGESEYVFVSVLNNDLPMQVNILETGFGTGLNFLLSAKKFLNKKQRLNFVSIESNPLSKEDIYKIYKNLGVNDCLLDAFLNLYPPLTQGFHRINLTSNITLTLCFYDINLALDELSFKANFIFLDGFSPSKNEAMWSEKNILKISNLCQSGTILRTYTASVNVQRALKNAGFIVDLQRGYNKKRQMIVAKFDKDLGQTHKQTAYFSRFDSNSSKNFKTALIIGGGVAGCVMAFKLKQLGVDVTIAEKRDDIATNGSSNHCGILMPLITKPDVKLGKMHLNAFLQAQRFYQTHLSKNEFETCEVIDYAHEPKLVDRLIKWQEFDLSNGVFDVEFDAKPYPKAIIKNGGKARPRKMCKVISKDILILYGYEFLDFKNLQNGRILANFKNGKTLEADILILALGSNSMDLLSNYKIPLSSVRGQVTHIRPILDCLPFSSKGYVCPSVDGVQVIGATYDRNLFISNSRSEDDIRNLADVAEFLSDKKVEIIGSNVGFRGYSGDRFALIGRLCDEKFYKNEYKSLLWNKNKPQNEPRYISNVYVNTAHGSRGLCTAVLGAELIADLIFDRPLCIEKTLYDELHLARFLIRLLKKGFKS